jgi:citrate lyase subunit beta/citryl-CoA lyase
LEKGKTLPADVLIFDLEDAVGSDAKAESRARVCDAVASGGYHPREIVVRINGFGTQWHDDDLAAAARSGAHGVLVPKVERGEQVRALVAALESLGAPTSLQLWVMVETPGAFLRVEEIASASDRLVALVVGTNDLVNDLHALHVPGRATVVPALSLAVLGARAAGKAILDGVFNNIADADGFRLEARQGREMGFDGKTLIHPSQIGPANEVFGPSQQEVDDAGKIVSAYERARAEGKSVITVDGRMIEGLHVRDAQRVLALAELIDQMGSHPAD